MVLINRNFPDSLSCFSTNWLRHIPSPMKVVTTVALAALLLNSEAVAEDSYKNFKCYDLDLFPSDLRTRLETKLEIKMNGNEVACSENGKPPSLISDINLLEFHAFDDSFSFTKPFSGFAEMTYDNVGFLTGTSISLKGNFENGFVTTGKKISNFSVLSGLLSNDNIIEGTFVKGIFNKGKYTMKLDAFYGWSSFIYGSIFAKSNGWADSEICEGEFKRHEYTTHNSRTGKPVLQVTHAQVDGHCDNAEYSTDFHKETNSYTFKYHADGSTIEFRDGTPIVKVYSDGDRIVYVNNEWKKCDDFLKRNHPGYSDC